MATPRSEMTEEQREKARAADRHWHKMRDRGTPVTTLAHEHARAVRILRKARQAGMHDTLIAERVGTHGTVIRKHRIGEYKTMSRWIYDAICRLEPEEFTSWTHAVRGKVPAGGRVPLSHGVARRLNALRAMGHTVSFLGEQLGTTHQAVFQLCKREDGGDVYYTTWADVCRVYEKYRWTKPEDIGIPAWMANRSRAYSRRNDFAGPECWDDEWHDDDGRYHCSTLDDVNGFPDWTGACGTPKGYELHKTYGIRTEGHGTRRDRIKVLCEPCRLAKREETAVSYGGVRADSVYDALDQGHTMREIAAKFHCSLRTVQRYRHEWAETRNGD